MDSTRSFYGLAVITITCAAGLLRAPWWAALAGACVLVLVSLSIHRHAYVPYSPSHHTVSQSTLMFSGVLNAATAAGAAFMAGRLIGWAWGL